MVLVPKKTPALRPLSSWLAQIGRLGILPSEFVSFFAGADLFALPKIPSGIRPIAVSLCIRRIISSSILNVIPSARISAFFLPFQFGVGAKNGVETIAHTIRIASSLASKGFIIWQNDAKNAFNCISRNAIREGLVTSFPEILPWFDLCYSGFGKLRVLFNHEDNSTSFVWLDSQEGTQQGDPLGPFFFCVAHADSS
jgi:hypothetical protein